MSLKREFETGKMRAKERRDEAQLAVRDHQEAVNFEQSLVRKFFDDLKAELPIEELSELDIHADVSGHWSQLSFVHWSLSKESEKPLPSNPKLSEIVERARSLPSGTSVASLQFQPGHQQFIYSDFLSDFKRRLPLPPNRASFGVIAKYLGESVAYFIMPEEDQEAVKQVNAGLRQTLN